MIYLDNAATTPMHSEVLKAMMPYMTTEYGNAGTIYGFGRNAAKAVENARGQVARFIGASPEQVIFTSGGSEANSMVFRGVADYLRRIGKTKILISSVEHDSVIKAAQSLGRPTLYHDKDDIKSDFDIEFIKVLKDGCVDIAHLKSLLEAGDVGLVSVMYENNEVGAINPVKHINTMCKIYGALFHTDCVQAAGCCDINAEEIGCDFLSISSHKIFGPKGIGCLYARDKSLISPIIYGGENQEYGYRGGTENVPGIVGFGKACSINMNHADATSALKYLFRLFLDTLLSDLNDDEIGDIISVNGMPRDCGKILNLRIRNIDSETLVLMLDAEGVCVSAGSACRSLESQPSHVLTAMGLSPDEARDSVRISFSVMNSPDEVYRAAKIFAKCISTLCVTMI